MTADRERERKKDSLRSTLSLLNRFANWTVPPPMRIFKSIDWYVMYFCPLRSFNAPCSTALVLMSAVKTKKCQKNDISDVFDRLTDVRLQIAVTLHRYHQQFAVDVVLGLDAQFRNVHVHHEL